jgi:ribose transport system permease protein
MTVTSTVPIQTTSKARWRSYIERYLLVGIWVALYLVFVAINPSLFLQQSVIFGIFSSADIYVFLGLAAMLVFYVGEFDLSIAFTMGLSATTVPVLYSNFGVPILVAVLGALIASLLVGLLNGFVIVKLGVDAMTTTLGTGTVMLGLSMAISRERPVGGLPAWFSQIAAGQFLGMTLTFWYGLIIALVLAYIIWATPLGRRMTFVGSSREVSRLAGIRVNRIRYGSYVVGAVVAGIAGVLLSAKLGGFDAAAASGYMLPTFAIVFVSAAVVVLGRFNPIGVLIAAYFIATGSLGLQLLGLSGWSQQVFYGGSLVVAVAMVTRIRKRKAS